MSEKRGVYVLCVFLVGVRCFVHWLHWMHWLCVFPVLLQTVLGQQDARVEQWGDPLPQANGKRIVLGGFIPDWV